MTEKELYAFYIEARLDFWAVHDRLVQSGLTGDEMRMTVAYQDADEAATEAYRAWSKAVKGQANAS